MAFFFDVVKYICLVGEDENEKQLVFGLISIIPEQSECGPYSSNPCEIVFVLEVWPMQCH